MPAGLVLWAPILNQLWTSSHHLSLSKAPHTKGNAWIGCAATPKLPLTTTLEAELGFVKHCLNYLRKAKVKCTTNSFSMSNSEQSGVWVGFVFLAQDPQLPSPCHGTQGCSWQSSFTPKKVNPSLLPQSKLATASWSDNNTTKPSNTNIVIRRSTLLCHLFML